MLADILALLVILRDVAEALSLAAEIIDDLTSAYDLLFGLGEPSYAELDDEAKTAILKRCTKIVANLDLTINCYPLGFTTTILFDHDGNPLP